MWIKNTDGELVNVIKRSLPNEDNTDPCMGYGWEYEEADFAEYF